MKKNKIALEIDSDDWFEFMKWKETVDGAAVIITNKENYRNGIASVYVIESMKIISKQEVFEKINKKLTELETEILEKNNTIDALRDQLSLADIKKKKYFWQ